MRHISVYDNQLRSLSSLRSSKQFPHIQQVKVICHSVCEPRTLPSPECWDHATCKLDQVWEMLKCETAHLQLHEVKRQKKNNNSNFFFHKWKMFRDKRRAAGVHQANQMEVVSIWDSHMLSLARCFFNWTLNWTITFSSKVRISIVGHLILMREVGADLSSSFSENDNTVWFRGMTSAKVKTYETFSVLMQWLKHGWMLVFLFFSYFLFGLFPNFLLPLPTHHLALTYHTTATNQGGWRKTSVLPPWHMKPLHLFEMLLMLCHRAA